MQPLPKGSVYYTNYVAIIQYFDQVKEQVKLNMHVGVVINCFQQLKYE